MNLDNIFTKAKEVFETAYKKTGDAVNVGKQRFDISSLENKLNKSYEILGKLCYDSVVNGGVFDAESVKPVTDDIAEKLAQIEEMKKEVLKTKNKKLCPKCSEPVDKEAAFCSSCGASLEEGKA